jgi:hypothetical protein
VPLESDATALIVYFPQAMPENDTVTTWVPDEDDIEVVCGSGVASPESRGVSVTVSLLAVGRRIRDVDFEEEELVVVEVVPCTINDSLSPALLPEFVSSELWQAQAITAARSTVAATEKEAAARLFPLGIAIALPFINFST